MVTSSTAEMEESRDMRLEYKTLRHSLAMGHDWAGRWLKVGVVSNFALRAQLYPQPCPLHTKIPRSSQFAFFGKFALWGDFPIQSNTWQVEVTSGSTGSSRTPIYVYTEHAAQFVNACVRGQWWRRTVGTVNSYFHEGRGIASYIHVASLGFSSVYPQ